MPQERFQGARNLPTVDAMILFGTRSPLVVDLEETLAFIESLPPGLFDLPGGRPAPKTTGK